MGTTIQFRNNNSILLSIIIPIYNGSLHLSSTLDSLLLSGIDSLSVEVIMVNDGSTDNSLEICKKYLDKYPELFRLCSKENGGLSSARNYGLAEAKGDYVFFLDDDDLIRPGAFKYFYDNYYDERYDILGFSSDTINYGDNIAIERGSNGTIIYDGCGLKFMECTTPTFVWVYWYKRSFLKDNMIDFALFFPEDVMFNLSVFRLNPRIRITSQKVICYMNYREQGQLTKMRDADKLLPILEGYMTYFHELSSSRYRFGLSSQAISHAIGRQIIPFVSRCLSSCISCKQFKTYGRAILFMFHDVNSPSLYSRFALFILRTPILFPLFKVLYKRVFERYILPHMSRA